MTMGLWQRLLQKSDAQRAGLSEKRSAPTSWDLMRNFGFGVGFDTESGSPVSPWLAENLSSVYACVQIISH